MRRAHVTITMLLTLCCSVILFSASVSPSSNRPSDRTSFARINEIYAPFDSLYTDITDYIWPTNASTVITSSFGDFRRTHFHEGIDISTNNQKGYPVYASRDGYVFRIRFSPRGYGKMLYLRHPDGFVTTYAHLQKFNNEINSYVKQFQKQRRSWPYDVEIDTTQFVFKKGDVIAYTGDTGIGSAHLHFEVRDSSMNPVNPFLLPVFTSLLKDNSPPVFQSLAFSPLGHSSIIQGKRRPWVANIKRIHADEYRLDGVMHLTGSIGISVKATDGTEGTYYKTGIHRYEFYVDDQLIFTSVKNRIPESESKQIAMYYDWGLLRTKRARFEKLYVVPGSRLPFYNRLPEGAGAIETSSYDEGEHNIKIIAFDLAGNQSILTLKALFNHSN
ncbi:MAG: M23 family metallopeptidase [Ignavibacteriales bacterium]|nr:M23 family metallopeptidase [Ignavibacteriales bacterium]